MPACAATCAVAATVVAPVAPRAAAIGRSRALHLTTSSRVAIASSAASSSPTRTVPSTSAIVAGTAPPSRTAASICRAISAFCGRGSPWETIVDSSATTACPAASASATSGATVIIASHASDATVGRARARAAVRSMDRYADRADAGRRLAPLVAAALHPSSAAPLVLALPRGGVPVGAEVAAALAAPLDVLLVRKLGVPEPAGARLRRDRLRRRARPQRGDRLARPGWTTPRSRTSPTSRSASCDAVSCATAATARPPPSPRRTVVVVDDGLATGATMRVAVLALRDRGAARVIAAAPVGSEEACGLLDADADAVVCPLVPQRFKAVGAWYKQFKPVPDEDVGAILRQAWTEWPSDQAISGPRGVADQRGRHGPHSRSRRRSLHAPHGVRRAHERRP